MKKFIQNVRRKINNSPLVKAVAALILIGSLCSIGVETSKASGNYYGPSFVVLNTTTGTGSTISVFNQTNNVTPAWFGTNSGATGWPGCLTNNQTGANPVLFTNYIPVAIPQGVQKVALSFTVQGTNSTTTSNTVWALYRQVLPQTFPTNAFNTGTINSNSTGPVSVFVDLLGYVTNFMNGTNSVTTIANFGYNPEAAQTGQGITPGIGGCSTIYIGYVSLQGQTGLTNVIISSGFE